MPSENKTPNIGLNQWEGNEYIKRQDFVDDNALIDAAIQATREEIHSVDERKADLENGKVPTSQLPDMDYLSPEGEGENVSVTFTESGNRVNISTGEKLAILFGKIKKYLTDLKTVAFTGNYSDLSGRPTSLPASGGNADTALKLATPRNINGVAFDGTQNITIVDNTKAHSSHTHTRANITDFPSSLPANGGNADTVDSKHIWIGTEVSKGTDANTIYLCY